MFVAWEQEQHELQLDIETNVTPYWCDKELITVQFGSTSLTTEVNHQWVLQWSELNETQRAYVKAVNEGSKVKLIHNAAFEIIVLRFHGMYLANVFDTMLCEKIITAGIDNENYALTDLCFKYLYLTLDKTEQLTFGDNILTENKVVYAAADVTHLSIIRSKQMPEITKWKLEAVLDLENEAVLAFSDITFNGMTLDTAKWKANEDAAQPLVDDALLRLNSWLTQPEFNEKALELKVLSPEDTILINYNSPAHKIELLKEVFPNLEGASMPILKKYVRDNGPSLSTENLNVLLSLQEKNTEPFEKILLRDHRDYLVENGFLRPANVPSINWNSVAQALPIIKMISPRLKDLSEESLSNVIHPIVDDLANYKDSLKLISTYGQSFVDKHVEPDGKVRTQFNQIVSTGRVSSKKPNMQNIPAKEGEDKVVLPWLAANPGKKFNDFTTRYRNAFVCRPEQRFVDSDFTGQELAIIAHISKDEVWLGAIERGEDLHSVCAELVFGKKWLDAKQDGCEYYIQTGSGIAKNKCKCKGHKTLRNSVKTINFGLAYGMGDVGLANKIKSTKQEAAALIDQYFKAFPKIGGVLKYLGEFGVRNGYIQTIKPYFRKRWFPFWKFANSRIEAHISGQNDPTLGTIERASKNSPIQGCGADMMKLAMVMCRRWIVANNYRETILLVAQVHDQLTTICDTEEIAIMWKPVFDQIMQDAGKVFIPSGILKADTQITLHWTK